MLRRMISCSLGSVRMYLSYYHRGWQPLGPYGTGACFRVVALHSSDTIVGQMPCERSSNAAATRARRRNARSHFDLQDVNIQAVALDPCGIRYA